MLLGGPIHASFDDPDEWVAAVRAAGYPATFSPVGTDASTEEITAYRERAEAADVVIAEVPGFGPNPLARNESERQAAVADLTDRLRLADDIGARCLVNIAGSRHPERWDGPHPENYTDRTFDRIVESVQEVIDAVEPTETYFTLETMPWMYPDSVESYRRLVDAIDRDRFGVHFDPVNLVNSPRRYYATDELIREFIDELGPHIRSGHLKDIALGDELTTHLDEVRPGTGNLDYHQLLRSIDDLDREVPMLLEHLDSSAEYETAAAYVRSVGAEVGVSL